MAWFVAALLSVGWLAGIIAVQRQQRGTVKRKGSRSSQDVRELLFMHPFRLMLERSGMLDRMQSMLSGLHGQLVVLHGLKWSVSDTRQYVSQAAGYGYAAACGGAWLSVLAEEPAMLLIGFLLLVVLPLFKWREASTKSAARKQDIVLALPELLSKLVLLLGAGETVQGALMRCSVKPAVMQERDNPLQEELSRACDAIRNGESFAAAMEAFSRRCAVQEVSVFTTTLLLNYRRGGDKLVLSIRELTFSLWEKRKAVARSRGEEASSKLVFPLVGIFLVLMILVASPAVLLMGL